MSDAFDYAICNAFSHYNGHPDYGQVGSDDIGETVLKIPEMIAIRNVLIGLSDYEWNQLPHNVREWAFGGTIKE